MRLRPVHAVCAHLKERSTDRHAMGTGIQRQAQGRAPSAQPHRPPHQSHHDSIPCRRAFLSNPQNPNKIEDVAATLAKLERGDLKLRVRALEAERALTRVQVGAPAGFV